MYRSKVNKVPVMPYNNSELTVIKGETGAIRMSVSSEVVGLNLQDICVELSGNEAYTLAQALLAECGEFAIMDLTGD